MFASCMSCGCVVALLASGWVWYHAATVTHSAIHEILAALLLLIAATLLTGLGIMDALERVTRRLGEPGHPAVPDASPVGPDPAPGSPPLPDLPALRARASLLRAAQGSSHHASWRDHDAESRAQ
jgi:hypothetical protein